MRRWHAFDPQVQLTLQRACQAHLDTQPPSCDLDDKVAAFAEWLGSRDIGFSKDDLWRK